MERGYVNKIPGVTSVDYTRALMLSELESAAHRFSSYAAEVLAPAVHPATVALRASVVQSGEPIPYAEAAGAFEGGGGRFEPVEIGWRWGPAWSTAWFRVQGAVPTDWAGRTVALRFSCGTEALLWQDGAPVQGFDQNRDRYILPADLRAAPSAGALDLLIEAACNRPLGATTFWWDSPDEQSRWKSDRPGCLERCELALFDETVWRLWTAYEFARELLPLLPPDEPGAHALGTALARATNAIDDRDVARHAPEALEIVESALRTGAAPAATRVYAVGHAHIDTAWLWPIRETRRKCQRTFANVLGLMDRFDDFRFACSQPQQYAWVEADAPELFARITERIREGRWEATGAMWIEPDANIPSGESLIRQIIHGVRYFQERFGDAAPQRVLYLPDTFGFSAALPQIMAGSGLDTFITNKLSWNERNEFPHVTFRWRGLDGTEVLAHCTPGNDYNAANRPEELRRGAANAARKDRGRTGVWLQPFGFGDGGGGPTDETIRRAQLSANADGLPRVALARMDSLCEALHRQREERRAGGADLPLWDGELYLERHRGTYTTQAWLKRANRRAEAALGRAEWLTFAGPGRCADARAIATRLEETWKLVLLNQFHDILPGSSIRAVYDDARRQYAEIDQTLDAIVGDGVDAWRRRITTTGLTKPILVLNPGSTPRSGVVEVDGSLVYARDVPPLGGRVVDGATDPGATPTPGIPPVTATGDTLANGIITARIDDAGRVTSLHHVALDREACGRTSGGGDDGRTPLNQLVLYEDRPRSWEAWDIDAEHVEKATPLDVPGTRRVVEEGPLRAAIEVEREFGAGSRITQRFVLTAGSPRLDVVTRIDWNERHRLLRAYFPVDVRSRRVTHEIQFGHIERPTHANTSWEEAMFEVCAHRWADLSEHGFGVALLNDGKYGHTCDGNTMGLTLLRGPEFQDPDADRGRHEFTYALLPHEGDWRKAGVDREAESLNAPMIAVTAPPDQTGDLPEAWAPFRIDDAPGTPGVTVVAVKRAEDDDRLIVRLVETHGGRAKGRITWALPVEDVRPVDLLERSAPTDACTHDAPARETTFDLGPFRILTLAATLTT